MGIAGGAVAFLLFYLLGTIALLMYLRSSRSLLKPAFWGVKLHWTLFRDILRVGLMGSISTLSTNLAIVIATTLAGHFGAGAIAGYGTASRIEYLLVPLVFGFGAPLVAMVGTCMGAGQHERALRAAWAGAAMSFVMTESIGIAAALFPRHWLQLFGDDPAMLETGTQYLQVVGPLYGFFGVGLVLYFASQGAGRLLWPVISNLLRLLVAGVGGWFALQWSGELSYVFAMQGIALVIYGGVIASAIAGGAWFGRLSWPRTTTKLLKIVQSGES
jgi:Na+-driven multidrug efflux pump